MSESEFKASDSESDKEVENNESSCDKVSTFRQNRSRVWDFFDKLEHRSGYAECKMCQLQMSYKSSVSNLSKHAMRKHKIIWQKAANVGIPKHIPELVHFKQNNGSNVASCKLCNESVSCTRPNLRKHLASCHPKIQLDNRTVDDQKPKIFISENGQFYEIETAQDDQDEQQNTDALEMDTVFLDEYIDEIKEAAGKKKKQKSTYYTPTTRKSQVTVENNTNEEQLEAKYTSPKLSKLDIFCTYLISLLKELPDRECTRLQGEFVNAAIQAQLRCEKEAVTVPVPDGDLDAPMCSRPNGLM